MTTLREFQCRGYEPDIATGSFEVGPKPGRCAGEQCGAVRGLLSVRRKPDGPGEAAADFTDQRVFPETIPRSDDAVQMLRTAFPCGFVECVHALRNSAQHRLDYVP